MNVIAKAGLAIVAVIFLLTVWMFGSPPAVSIFWEHADVTVSRHETRQVNDGYGVVERTDPIVEVDGGARVRAPIRLLVPNAVSDRSEVVSTWPAGRRLTARISPGGHVAYPSTWRPVLLIPAVILTVVLALFAFRAARPFFDRRWKQQGGPAVRRNAGFAFRPFALGFGVIFTAVPLVLAYFFWSFGDPPPYSIAWPRHEATVLNSEVRRHVVGNGTVAAYLDVTVDIPGTFQANSIALQGVTYGWIPIPEAEKLREAKYMPGATVRAMESPNGDYYVVRWRFADFLALLIIPLGLITVPVGLFALRLALQ